MPIIKRWNVGLIAGHIFTACSVSAFAADIRMGVPYAEDVQRQQAISAASSLGNDTPLDVPDPLVAPVVNPQLQSLVMPSEIERQVEKKLAPVTLEEQIQNQGLTTDLEQFGYNIFTSLPTTFAPVEGIPVPPDYMIGPGDGFILQIFSATDIQYNLVVNREGKLLIPEVGPIQVAGLTFEETKLLIDRTLSSSRMGVKTVLTLSNLQTIQVMLVGEVIQPGSYVVSGLSTLLNTLITAGGVKRTGSLRNIQVKRGGSTVAEFDLYKLLLEGDTTGNISLRQGDVVFIPPIGPVVSVAGEVLRPAIYEIADEESVADVVRLAGGALATAALEKTQVERIQSAGNYTLIQTGLSDERALTPIKNGDFVRVYPVLNQMNSVALLKGNVLTPGGYEWTPDMRVSDLIGDRSTLRQGTDFSVALIERENPVTKRSEAIYVNLAAALDRPGSVDDLGLEPRDRLTIFDVSSDRSKRVADLVDKLRAQSLAGELPDIFSVKGAVKHSGDFPLARGTRLLNALTYVGGLKPDIDREYVLLVRSNASDGAVEFINLSLKAALENSSGDHNPYIKPSDRIYVFDQRIDRSGLIADDLYRLAKQASASTEPRIVEVSGSVRFPGRYPLTPGMRTADLVIAAGGMTEDSFGVAATLSRQIELEGEFVRTEVIDVSLSSRDPMLNGIDTILEPRDHLVIRQKPQWIDAPRSVSVTGEVLYPGDYKIEKGETLCSVIQKVGGFTEDAYLFGTVFTRESVRRREQDALDRIYRQIDDLLADVHLSPGVNKDNKLPVNQSTADTFKVIQQLKPEKAAGRMVIDMERAVAKCDESVDIVLEDGDSIFVPPFQQEVSVVGQVYFPASHQFNSERGALDYINLSGGTKELAQREHVYIVQANGEVMTVRSMASTWGWLLAPSNTRVTPGSTIYVPLSVDRINGREFAQSWVDLVYKLTLSAASIDFLFGN